MKSPNFREMLISRDERRAYLAVLQRRANMMRWVVAALVVAITFFALTRIESGLPLYDSATAPLFVAIGMTLIVLSSTVSQERLLTAVDVLDELRSR